MNEELVVEKLKKEGLKVTPQRLAIIKALVAMGDLHPSARAVYREAKRMLKSLSLSTTYATLNAFSTHGIIKTLQFDPIENRYDGNLQEHLNLICKRCGKIFDYEVRSLADHQRIAKETGFLVEDTRLECYGYCGNCHAKT
jgi:Fur family transcriptional regulator, peroxide stress response regulator